MFGITFSINFFAPLLVLEAIGLYELLDIIGCSVCMRRGVKLDASTPTPAAGQSEVDIALHVGAGVLHRSTNRAESMHESSFLLVLDPRDIAMIRGTLASSSSLTVPRGRTLHWC